MSPHGKKMIAPVVITIIFLLYLFIYGAMLMQAVVEERWLHTGNKILLGLVWFMCCLPGFGR